jgi:hypothetical protein
MVVRRCAWHGRYFGHWGGLGIDSWRGGLKISYTDGICQPCAARMRAEPTENIGARRALWLATLHPQRAALAGAALGIVSILALPSAFLDETLWRPTTVIIATTRVVEIQPGTERRTPRRRVLAARPRQAPIIVPRLRSGTRGVLDPLIAWAGTTEVSPAPVISEPAPPPRDNPPPLPALEESWVVALPAATPAPPARKPALLAMLHSPRDGMPVEAP